MGNDLYPSIYDAAQLMLWHCTITIPLQMVTNELHSIVCTVYLIINGYDIIAPQQDVENLIINVAAGRMYNTELSKWLQKNTVQTENL